MPFKQKMKSIMLNPISRFFIHITKPWFSKNWTTMKKNSNIKVRESHVLPITTHHLRFFTWQWRLLWMRQRCVSCANHWSVQFTKWNGNRTAKINGCVLSSLAVFLRVCWWWGSCRGGSFQMERKCVSPSHVLASNAKITLLLLKLLM